MPSRKIFYFLIPLFIAAGVFLYSLPANAAISLIQQESGFTNAGTSTFAITMSSSTLAGDLISACIGGNNNIAVQSIGDTDGDTFTSSTPLFAVTGSIGQECFYAKNTTPGSGNVVTFTFTSSSTKNMGAFIDEFSGIATTSPLDIVTTSTNALGLSISAPTGTTSKADLMVAFVEKSGGGATFTPGSGFTLLTPNASITAAEYLVQSNAGSQNASMSWNVNGSSTITMEGFLPAITTSTAPQLLTATSTNAQVTLSWNVPSSNGGSSLTQYQIFDRFTGSSTFSMVATTTPAQTTSTLSALTNGQSYDFEVLAQNSAGTSTASNIVSSTPFTVPDAPTNATGTPGNGQATISFSPGFNEGSAITFYTVTSNPSNFTATGTGSPLIVTGLSNGTPYTFTVTATNAAGTSASSTPSGTITPVALPVINSFVASSSVINNGSSSLLSWNITGATIVSINNGIGGQASTTSGSVTVSPTSTTTYILTATNGSGSATSSVTVSMASITNGLAAYWTFEDGPGATTLADSSGNSNTAAVSGTPAFARGQVGSYALQLSGSAATGTTMFAYAPSSTSLNITGDLTVSAWINTTSTSQGRTIFGYNKTTTTTAGYAIAVASGGNPTGTIDFWSAPEGIWIGGPTSTLVNDGTWHLVTVTAASGTGYSFYIDGVLKEVVPASTTAAASFTGNAGIGVNSFLSGGYWAGEIDDLRVYNRALAPTEVKDLDSYSAPAVPTAPQSLGATPGNAQVALTWSAPSSSGSSSLTQYLVYDRFTGSSTFSLYATTTPSQTTSTVTSLTNGQSYDFEVLAQNGVGTSTASNIASGTPTLPVPVINSFTASSSVISVGSSSVLSWNITGATSVSIDNGIGAEASTTAGSITVLPTSTTTYTLTATNAGGSVTSTATVSMASITSGLVAYWNFEDGPGAPTLNDSSGNNNTAIVSGTPTFAAGKVGSYAFQLSGAATGSMFAYAPSSTSLTNVTGDLTISAWINTTNTSQGRTIFGYNKTTTTTAGYALAMTAGGNPTGTIDFWDAPLGTWISGPTSTLVNNGVWHLVTVTAASGTGYSFYIDGALKELVAQSSTAPAAFSGNAGIGADSLLTGGYWAGEIDDLRVYNRALAPVEVQTLFNFNGPPATSTAPQSLAAVATSTQVALTWSAPSSNGGSSITQYLVYDRFTGSSTFALYATTTALQTTSTVTSLTNGQSYDFEVLAQNSVGTSTASNIVSSTPFTLPGVPTGASAVGGNAQATISFTAPVSNGGSAITFYTVTSNPSNFTATGTGSPITVTGLSNGTPYTFTVIATNPAGNSASSSASNSVTPAAGAATPTVPTGLSVSATTPSTASLSWIASTDASGTVSGYKIYRAGVQVGTSNSISFTDSGLAPNTSYAYSVAAFDTLGDTSATSSRADALTGAYINAAFPPLTSTTTGYSNFSNVLASNLVDGINPGVLWSSIDHGPGASGGQYQWGTLDAELQRFITAGKKVNLVIWPMGYSNAENAPSYVLNDPTLDKVSCGTTTTNWPVVYENPFKIAYKAFITQVVQHYANDPNIGYIRFGLSRGGETFPVCETQEAALSGLTTSQWESQVWVPYYKEMVDYEKAATPTMQILAPTTQAGNPDMTDSEAPYAVGDGFSFGNQGLEKSDITNYPSCTGDWCNLFNTYYNGNTLELQTIGQSDAAGILNDKSNQALTGPLPPLIEFAYQHHASIFEIYTDDLRLAFDPTYCNNLSQCTATYGTTYTNGLAAVHGMIADATTTPPAGLTGSPGSTQVGLSWSAPVTTNGSAISQYTISYKLSASSTFAVIATTTYSVTSGTITGLTNGVSYDFEVAAQNGVGTSAASNIITAIPTGLPPTINSFTASPSSTISGQSSLLSWNISAAANVSIDHNVGTQNSTSTGSVLVAPTSTTMYTLTAVNENGTRTATTSIAVTADVSPPTVPGSLRIAATSTFTVSLAWATSTDNVGVAGYEIFRSGTEIATGTVTNYTDTGLSASTNYTYYVSAFDAAGNFSATSTSVNATTGADTTPPDAITDLTAGTPGTSTVLLSWTAPFDPAGGQAESYDLRYSTTTITSGNFLSATEDFGIQVPAFNGVAETYTLGGLDPDTTYSIAMESADLAGNVSALSDVADITTAALVSDQGSGGGQTSGGSGGGGGGGAGGTYIFPVNNNNTTTITSTSSLEAELASLEALLQQLLLKAGAAPNTVFTRDLSLWDTGKDVTALQAFLVARNTGPAARKLAGHGTSVTFGLLTYHALQEYQYSVGVPATGYFGPLTRKAMLE